MAAVGDQKSKYYEKRAKRRAIRALHQAISDNKLSTVRDLITPDLDVNFHYNGKSSLQIAVVDGFEDICRLLIENGADVNKVNAEGNCLLNMAVWHGHTSIVQLLMDSSAELDISNNHGSTPVSTAAYCGDAAAVQMLIRANCDIDAPDKRGQSPLLVAAWRGHLDVIRELVGGQCDINWTDYERRTAVNIAAGRGHLDVVRALVDAGCNLDLAEQYSCTALFFAAQAGYTDIVQTLVDAGADLNKTNTRKCTPIMEAVKGKHMEVMKILIAADCDVNYAELQMMQAPIHVAVQLASHFFGDSVSPITLVELLVAAGCDLNVSDKHGWTPLYQAAFSGETGLVELLLNQNVNVNTVTESLDTPLHAAVFGNKPEIMDSFIQAGCSVNAVNKRNELPLYAAIDHRSKIELIRSLLDAGSRTDLCESQSGQTPLFAAIQHDYIEAMDLLVKAGCDVNIPNRDGNTALWVACNRGNTQAVDILLRHSDIDIDAGVSHIPIHAAVIHGYTDIITGLLAAGCDVNKMSDICSTAIYFAADCNKIELAEMLIKHGANPSAPHRVKPPRRCCASYSDPHPHLELEPMYAAVKNNNFRMIKLLLFATPRMPYRVLKTLQDIIFRTRYAQESRMSEQLLYQYAEVFSHILSYPCPLQDSCRGVIRETLGGRLVEGVGKLPIPEKLKDFVLLKDVLKS